MALFRKFFYKKPPDGLLEISERVYVFDYCFTTDVMEEDEYKVYIGGIIGQLHDHFPDASYMVFNMREGENQSQIANILCDYDMTVMDYPRQYEGCPLLTMEMIHHFLRSGENWLQLGQQNVVLMHCERGGWPVLAFMLAALLIYRKQFTGEQKTLDMIYKQAPRELLQLMSPLNPLPSQLRYLQYISRRNVGSEWPPLDRALTLDCVIIRFIPNMDGEGGCRPIFRIYGQDPFMAADRTPKVLFSTPKRSKLVRHYKQADCELVKIDINCHVQGDVVLECISLDSDLEREKMMFRVMFNTAFIRSNILMLNRDEIDILWNVKDNFPKNFRVEVLFSDMEASSSVISIDLPRIDEKEGLPVEAFAKVKEMFNNVDWLDSNTEVANVLQQITASNILLERLDSGVSAATSSLLKESLSGRFIFDSKTQNDMKSPVSAVQGKLSMSFESFEDAPMEKKLELLESKELPENSIKTLAPMGQGNQPIPSFGLSTDSGSTKNEIESLGSKESLENDTKFPTSMAQGKQSIPSIEPSMDANSMKMKVGSFESKEKDIEPFQSKALLENDTKFPISVAQGKKSTSLIEPSLDANSMKKKIGLLESEEKEIESIDSKALLEDDSRFKFEPKMLPEIDIKSPTSAVQGKLSMSSFESSEDAPMEKEIESLESKASPENNIKTLAPLGHGKQPIPSSGLSTDSNSTKMQNEPFQSKALLENDTKFPISVAQGKKSTPLIEPSLDANSMKKKIGLLESEEKEIESIDSKALLEDDRRFKFEPKMLPEIDIKSSTSAVQGKLSMSSFESSEDAPMEKKIESLESKASPENNSKTLAPLGHGKQPIPSSGHSTDSNSTKRQNEPFQSKALLENDTKFPISVAQGKKSTPLIEPSLDANSVKKKIAPLESKEKDIESLESKALLENDNKCSTSMAQGKQSIPLIEPSMDANSMKKKIGQLESVVSENEIKSLTSTVERKQYSPLLEPSIDANSTKKKIEPQELQVALQLPTQSKIISPRVRQAIRSAPVSYSNSLQGSPVAMSRYHSVPSALGLTTVLQDDAPMDIKEEVTQEVTVSPSSSTLSPSDSKVPKSVEPSSISVPPASSPALLPSSPLKSSVNALAAIEKTSGPLASAAPSPPPPPPPPPQREPTSKLIQPIVIQHPENTMLDKGQKSLVTPPPPSLPVEAVKSSLSMPATPTPALSSPSSAVKSSSSHPPPSSLPGTSLSTVKDSFKGPPPPPPPLPPPPPSTGQTSSSSIPPPPPLSGLPSSAARPLSSPLSMNKSAGTSVPPPPPPPPGHSGTSHGPTLTSSVPPPPPPPASASKNSVSKNSANVPPVPPLPSPSANGLSKSGTSSLQSTVGVGNGNVPPVPGPPSGVPFGAKGRGLFRANPKSQSQTKRSNLKPYHWLKLTRAMQGSLWAETQKLDEASRAPEFDMSELESLFSAAAPNSDNGKGGKSNRRSSRQKADKVQLIELRRAYNCEIMLTKVKIPLPDLMSAVLALDDSVLYVDQVENLIKFCPTKEEMELLKGYNGDKDNLGKCEQFFLELMKVPRVENKLRVFSFKMQFCSQVSELKRDLNIVNSASEEIRNSVKLKRIMQTILSLGNALNHGTARGSAIGFRLDSLLKLTDTRARNNKMTLMHYLCKVLAEKLPELLDFPKDLVNLEASTKIQLKYLAEEMQAISKGLEKVVQELTASENDGPVSENFCQILKEFLSDAEAEVRSLAQLYANVGRNADALALYFGEDPARCPFEQVVSTLLNFVRMFVRAHDENCKQLEYEKKRAEKEAEKLAAKKESEHMIRTTIKSGNIK